MLNFVDLLPEGGAEDAPLLVLLHGRGASERDLVGLRGFVPPGIGLVLPRAPFPGGPWGYGPGWAWYRYVGEDRPDPESFSTSLRELDAFLAELPGRLGTRPGPIALGGFSQGGTLATAYALTHPGRVPFVLNFSGFLANHPEVRAEPETVHGARFFWGHGTADPAIPFPLAERGRAALRAAGAELEARDYPIGHWIDQAEIGAAMDWLTRGLREPSAGAPGPAPADDRGVDAGQASSTSRSS